MLTSHATRVHVETDVGFTQMDAEFDVLTTGLVDCASMQAASILKACMGLQCTAETMRQGWTFRWSAACQVQSQMDGRSGCFLGKRSVHDKKAFCA